MTITNLNRERFNWKLFGILYGAGLFGVLAIMPYLLAFMERIPAQEPPPFPLPVLLLLQFLQSAVMLAVAVGVGLLLAGKIGCGAPLIERWLRGERVKDQLRATLKSSISVGAGVALILLLLLIFVFFSLAPELRAILTSDVALWKKFLASFYGGIVEELLIRLFLMSLLAWLLGRFWRKSDGLPTAGAMWTANALAAIIFGLGHLPLASVMMPLTPVIVIAALLLNGIAGMAFGYLYWKRGLEAAMIAHFSADIVLHVIGSAAFRV